jgi:hypothetical protein
MNNTQMLNLTDNQKIYLLSELQSKINKIIDKEVEVVEQFDDDGECYEDNFYIGSVIHLQNELYSALIETIL